MEGLLQHVPEEMPGRVRLIDLADGRGSPGINLLDTRVFSDRDRTVDSVVRVARGLWEQWGPRMQSILEQTVKTLHEANEHPTTDENGQHTILDGLRLVSTAQEVVGRDVAALVGASLLNLVDSVIREQGSMPLKQRRGALVVVDEMQSMPGVDYESMLSELGKFGASFILATQSLAKLEDLSRTMRDTLLANVGCLAVFQVAGNDARTLVWELGKDRVSEEDIVSLPVHHCYVRATVGTERMPAFSMMVRKPEEGDADTATRIREAASSYITTEEEIAVQQANGRRRVEMYRKGVQDIRNDRRPSPNGKDDKVRDRERRQQRSKHFQPPSRGMKDATANEEKE